MSQLPSPHVLRALVRALAETEASQQELTRMIKEQRRYDQVLQADEGCDLAVMRPGG